MDKAAIAEWMLSLFMNPAEAAALVGDLLEAEGKLGVTWFWSNIFQTFFASAWQDCVAHPLSVIRVAVLGALLQAALGIVGTFIWWLVYNGVYGVIIGAQLSAGFPTWLSAMMTSGYFFIGLLLAPLLSGYWSAKKSFSTGIAVGIYNLIVGPVIFFSLGMVSKNVFSSHVQHSITYWQELVCLGAFFVGVICVRRRQRVAA
jgi:hypothetical protein